jgi:hypothetical protein
MFIILKRLKAVQDLEEIHDDLEEIHDGLENLEDRIDAEPEKEPEKEPEMDSTRKQVAELVARSKEDTAWFSSFGAYGSKFGAKLDDDRTQQDAKVVDLARNCWGENSFRNYSGIRKTLLIIDIDRYQYTILQIPNM